MSFEARNALMLAKKVVDQAAKYKKIAQKAEGGAAQRKTNKIGLYSKAAEQARQLPSGSVPAAQLIGTLRNKGGIKAEELANAGITDQAGNLSPEWQARGKIAPEDLAAHFEQHLPEIEETVLQRPSNLYPYRDPDEWMDAIESAERRGDWDEVSELNHAWESLEGHGPSGTPKYEQYTLPGGENYREVLLKLKEPEIKGKPYHIVRNETFIPALKRAGVNPLDEDAIRRSIAMKNNPRFLSDPDKEKAEAAIKKLQESGETDALNAYVESFSYNDAVEKQKNKQFQSSHWDEPNILAHIRMADRTGPNGEKILHVEEVQSDWGQKGKKEGFAGKHTELPPDRKVIESVNARGEPIFHIEGPDEMTETSRHFSRENAINSWLNDRATVPPAPYVTSTQGWTDLALKRVLKEAAEGGYDKVVWTPGEEQAKRYDLSNQISKLTYIVPNSKFAEKFGTNLRAFDKNGNVVINKTVPPKELENHVGKEVAQRLINQEPDRWGKTELSGLDLSVGGEGMKEYYDNILPKRLQAVAQKHDKTAKISQSLIKTHGDEWPFSARIAHDGENYWVAGQSPSVSTSAEQQLSPKFKSYEEASNHRDLLYQGFNQPVSALNITPQMRDSIMKGQEGYARGGDVMHTRKVPKPHTPVVGERQHQSRHPASMIPGIHVVGAIHGIPYFTGKK